MTGTELLIEAVAQLASAGVDDPARDARRLLARALGCKSDRLGLHLGEVVDVHPAEAFQSLIQRRMLRQPVSQLIGGRYFFDHWFEVSPDVLDPRPETETLVRLALAQPFDRVLDLGTGSGAILLSLLASRITARGIGSDVSQDALAIASRNAAALGLSDRATLIRSDWFKAIQGRFDLIVSNPPYIAADEMAGLAPELRNWEPRIALTDGADGLSAYRIIAGNAAQHLTPGGHLMVEIGATQGAKVASLLIAAGFDGVAVHPDLDGRDRVVIGRYPA